MSDAFRNPQDATMARNEALEQENASLRQALEGKAALAQQPVPASKRGWVWVGFAVTCVTLGISYFMIVHREPALAMRASASSSESLRASVMHVTNTTPQPVTLNWINPDGAEVFYAAIEPGASVDQPTFETHRWRARDRATGMLISTFVATQPTESFSIAR